MQNKASSISNGISIKEIDDLDFGYKNFEVTFTSKPIDFYITKLFVCPVCGWEAEHHTNMEGEPKNSPFCLECFRKANIPIMILKNKEKLNE